MKSILGVDLDNVIAYTDRLLRKKIFDLFGIRLEQENVIHYEYWRCGISKEQFRIILERFHKIDCEFVEPIKKAIDALNVLHDKFEIHIVTSRFPESLKMTEDWLRNNSVPYDKLEFHENKNESRIKYRTFIEDYRETAYGMAERGIISFLLDYPWNQPAPVDPPNLFRVDSWNEILDYLN